MVSSFRKPVYFCRRGPFLVLKSYARRAVLRRCPFLVPISLSPHEWYNVNTNSGGTYGGKSLANRGKRC